MREDVGKKKKKNHHSVLFYSEQGGKWKVKQSIFYSVYYKDELYSRTVMTDKDTHRKVLCTCRFVRTDLINFW